MHERRPRRLQVELHRNVGGSPDLLLRGWVFPGRFHSSRFSMYHHVKKLMYAVRVDEPDTTFGNMLLEQFGGANGELD